MQCCAQLRHHRLLLLLRDLTLLLVQPVGVFVLVHYLRGGGMIMKER